MAKCILGKALFIEGQLSKSPWMSSCLKSGKSVKQDEHNNACLGVILLDKVLSCKVFPHKSHKPSENKHLLYKA